MDKGGYIMEKDLSLNFSKVHKSVYDTLDWDKIYKLSLNGFMIIDSREAPYPWDAVIDISKDDSSIILSGGVGLGDLGSCTCIVPKNRFGDIYTVIIEPMDETATTVLKEMLKKVGIGVATIDYSN